MASPYVETILILMEWNNLIMGGLLILVILRSRAVSRFFNRSRNAEFLFLGWLIITLLIPLFVPVVYQYELYLEMLHHPIAIFPFAPLILLGVKWRISRVTSATTDSNTESV